MFNAGNPLSPSLKKPSVFLNCPSVWKRIVCGAIAVIMTASFVPAAVLTVSAGSEEQSKLEENKELLNTKTYAEYMEHYTLEYSTKNNGELPLGADVITVAAADFNAELSSSGITKVENYEGRSGASLLTPEDGDAVFNFTVKSGGLYNLRMTCIAVPGKTASIERSILVDGKTPFREARDITIQKTYKDNYVADPETGELGFKKDLKDNEIRSDKTEVPEWLNIMVMDSSGYSNDPLYFYLTPGEHTITVKSIKEQMVLGEIKLFCADPLPSYEQYLKDTAAQGAKDGAAAIDIIEAEYPLITSDVGIYALNDRTSAITSPQDTSRQRLNTIGSVASAQKWQANGQYIRWEFEVPAGGAGYYKIVPRFKQNKYQGLYSSRKLRIDGEIPFEEAQYLRFNFSDDWQSAAFTDGTFLEDGSPREFKFYLAEGKHTFELEVTLGTMADVLRRVEASLQHLNDMYIKIRMITGTNPDVNGDYGFERNIPDVLIGMDEESNILYGISAELEEIIGSKGETTVILDKIALQLRKMADNTDKIAAYLGNFKQNIGGLATWLLERTYQPLQLDLFAFVTPDTPAKEYPRANANFLQAFGFEMASFFASFFNDYSSLGATVENTGTDSSVTVWLETGRDQAQILRLMIDDDFTQRYGIATNVKLVAAGTLLPATLAGTGPDVAVFAADPINYALRGAVLPLNDYKGDESRGIAGFEEVKTWFNSTAFVPLTLQNDKTEKSGWQVFALPETQTFPMMFYRKDILAGLDIEIPKTWDELYAIIPELQKRNLEVGITPGLGTLTMFMYQQGELLYTGDGSSINLDSNTSLEAFKKMCDLYVTYKFPIEFNFVNRFRTGEMPIGIASYDTYNTLIVSATEIKGLWEFVPLPGTVRDWQEGDDELGFERTADGKVIDNRSPAGGSSIMMMRTAQKRDPENTWAFMQWWVSASAQSKYGNEMVALMGPAAKQPTANLQALSEMPWITADYKNLNEQFKHLAATPNVPGSYIVSRNVDFAWKKVYNDGTAPIDTMLDYIKPINKELSRKRAEFTKYDFYIVPEKELGERRANTNED